MMNGDIPDIGGEAWMRTDAGLILANGVEIPASCGVSRVATRPIDKRSPGFDEEFDATTLFYDVFVDAQGSLCMVGPPFWNLMEEVKSATFIVDGIPYEGTPQITLFDRCNICRLPGAFGNAHTLRMRIFGTDLQAPIGPAYTALFRGRRVVMTMSKDNDLVWVRDWAAFYAAKHRADAFLIFDNGSRGYSVDHLLQTVLGAAPNALVVVVPWPYKYGPQGGEANVWDSDFCQISAYNMARFRLLPQARALLNIDIDELIVDESGAFRSIFEATEAAESGYIRIKGRWIEPFSESWTGNGLPRHADFRHFHSESVASATKWCLVPHKCPDDALWRIHTVGKMSDADTSTFLFRHFQAINTLWYRRRYRGRIHEPGKLVLDTRLAEALATPEKSTSTESA
ncbi:MAG: hypothetical protein AAFY59_03325 [Pseudomonadota bacterium]